MYFPGIEGRYGLPLIADGRRRFLHALHPSLHREPEIIRVSGVCRAEQPDSLESGELDDGRLPLLIVHAQQLEIEYGLAPFKFISSPTTRMESLIRKDIEPAV